MDQNNHLLYEFGPYRLDERERILTRDGQPVSLMPKALETLLVLLRNSGHLVEKDQLMQEVWPETYVEEANLSQNIFVLRRVLGGGSAGATFIETVPRRGYRFAMAVRRVAAPAEPENSRASEPGWTSAVERQHKFVAVLPFVNEGGDASMDYLSDGITENIINSLSQLPQLRVMSRSTVFRYRGKELDAQRIGRELGVDAVLVGRVQSLDDRLLIGTELVDVINGWQLWGEHYDRNSQAIFEVQEEIARQISATLRIRLTGDEEQRLTKRYTENSEAYRLYLRGRYYWGQYSRDGLEQATIYFREAINLDPNYALAYAGLVDCYLRLATNYIPPTEVSPSSYDVAPSGGGVVEERGFLAAVQMRYEWDRTGAERELKRALELKSNYPAAHQWYAAYQFALKLYREAHPETAAAANEDLCGPAGVQTNPGSGEVISDGASRERRSTAVTGVAEQQSTSVPSSAVFAGDLPSQFQSTTLTPAEEVQIFCAIAREQIDAGNYEAACRVLLRWWSFGDWPTVNGLSAYSSADLLLTTGTLAGWIASAKQHPTGQKHAEALISGSIGLFEQLGARTRSAEARIELGYCYFREGLFDLARFELIGALRSLSVTEQPLRSIALIRLGIVDRHAGRLDDSLAWLSQASQIVEIVGPLVTGRYHHETATTLKEVAIAEELEEYFNRALTHYLKALREFEAIGNHRYVAILENNHGYLLLSLKRLDEAESRLVRAQKIFDRFGDIFRGAQVEETLAHLYMANNRLDLAESVINQSVQTLLLSGQEALLAESLTTQGIVLCKVGRSREGGRILDRAYQTANRCGDAEGAARALIALVEEIGTQLDREELREVKEKLKQLVGHLRQTASRERLRRYIEAIEILADGRRSNERE